MFEADAVLALPYLYIPKYHVLHMTRLSTLQHECCLSHLSAAESIYHDVAYFRVVGAVLPFTSIHTRDIEQVLHLIEDAIAHMNIPYKAAPVWICFYIYSTFAIPGIVTVFHKDILHAALISEPMTTA